MTGWLAGGVFGGDHDDECAEVRRLVDEIGRRSFEARLGHRTRPERFDDELWDTLHDTGLTRLTSSGEADPGVAAVVLRGLARHAGAVPVAETDLLAGWLAAAAGVEAPDAAPLTVAMADATVAAGRVTGTAAGVPWLPAAAAVLVAARTGDALLVAAVDAADLQVSEGHNLAGEPRHGVGFDLPVAAFTGIEASAGEELTRRGAWARCVQTVGVLDAAAEWSAAHTRERTQFGRPLSAFQAVQQALAGMAGGIERARAATTLAVAAATDHGFGSAQADYAVTVAKVVLGRVVPAVTTAAHQLHGAIGVTIEHRLWLATTRAHSWVDEFGRPGHHARRLGRAVLSADAWDTIVDGRGW
ncbi:acyl-CoA dehydrogenase [Mycobacterium eburneum]|nr:acyl-CoA dehydrogenase [Mycobacterium eburneum]